MQSALQHELALAVGRAGVDGAVFGDRDLIGDAEQVGGRRQHEARYALAHAGLYQPDAVDAVLQQIAIGLAHALADQGQGGEMEHAVPFAVG